MFACAYGASQFLDEQRHPTCPLDQRRDRFIIQRVICRNRSDYRPHVP